MNAHDSDGDATVIVRQQAFGRGQPPRARLICLDKFLGEGFNELEIMLVDLPQSLGRGAENSVQLKYKTLSREHARVVPENGRWVIEDLKSSNGVFVNDEKVSRHILTPGDIVKLASLSFRFAYDPLPQTTQIASIDPPTLKPQDEDDITLYGPSDIEPDAVTLRDDEVFAVPLSNPVWKKHKVDIALATDSPDPAPPMEAASRPATTQRHRWLIILLSALFAALSTLLLLLQTGLLTTQLAELEAATRKILNNLW